MATEPLWRKATYDEIEDVHGPAVLMWVVPVMTDERKVFRIFIGKHPCDDLPYIVEPNPDPRSPDFDPFRGIEGEDYSGWYVLEALSDDR